jgi:hypothetical protein
MADANLLNIKNLSTKSDFFGAIASAICLIHCLLTPFLFVTHAGMHQYGHYHHGPSPLWWNVIDIIFLIISLGAVYWSAKSSSKIWVKYILYASWVFLAFLILNEKFQGVHLPEVLIYIPAFSLIIFHLYNKKYCQCKTDGCCI